MDDHIKKLGVAIADFLFLALLTVAAPLIVYVDAVWIGHGVPECSATEITQEALLFLSALLFWIEAWRRPQDRAFFVLAGGFLACMFLREVDFLFDPIHHAFWIIPVAVTAVVCAVPALTHRQAALQSAADFMNRRSCIYISIGLLIAIVFSRIFGSGHLLWNHLLGEAYKSQYKAVIQEGLELFGYLFIFYGACLVPRER